MKTLVLVEWEDTCSCNDWQSHEEMKTRDVQSVKSVGYLVEKTKKHTTIISSVSVSAGGKGGFCTLCIPAGCIRRMKTIKE